MIELETLKDQHHQFTQVSSKPGFKCYSLIPRIDFQLSGTFYTVWHMFGYYVSARCVSSFFKNTS